MYCEVFVKAINAFNCMCISDSLVIWNPWILTKHAYVRHYFHFRHSSSTKKRKTGTRQKGMEETHSLPACSQSRLRLKKKTQLSTPLLTFMHLSPCQLKTPFSRPLLVALRAELNSMIIYHTRGVSPTISLERVWKKGLASSFICRSTAGYSQLEAKKFLDYKYKWL